MHIALSLFEDIGIQAQGKAGHELYANSVPNLDNQTISS